MGELDRSRIGEAEKRRVRHTAKLPANRRVSPSIFSGNDLLQAQQILERRRIVIGPFSFTGNFGLKPPRAAEFRGADFALFPMSIFLRPYVLTRHRGKTLH